MVEFCEGKTVVHEVYRGTDTAALACDADNAVATQQEGEGAVVEAARLERDPMRTHMNGFARLHMSIGTLTCLLMGYKTAAQLFERERIQGDAAGVEALDAALLHECPYISDYI